MPSLRASESPIAMACLQLFTVPPLPPLPLFNLPRLNLCISRSTSLEALGEYFLAIDELRDNIADIAGGVGDMASRQYEQAYDIATDAVEETGQIIRRNPPRELGDSRGVVGIAADCLFEIGPSARVASGLN